MRMEERSASRLLETERLRDAVSLAVHWETSPSTALAAAADFRSALIDAPAFLDAVQTHQMAGLIATHAAALALPDHIRSGLHELAVEQTIAGMSTAQATATAWELLDRSGIRAVAFKGPALSVQTTGAPAARGGGDIDLLVAPDDLHKAVSILTAARWQPWISPLALGTWWRWFEPANREIALIRADSTIDLHWRICLENGFLPSPRTMIDRAVSVQLPGSEVLGLGPDDLLLASAYAFQLDHFASLRYAVDLVRILQARREPIDFPIAIQRMVVESACAAAILVGGIDERQRIALGLPALVPSDRATEGWRRYGVHGRRPLAPRPIGQLLAVTQHRRYSTWRSAFFHSAVARALSQRELPVSSKTPPNAWQLSALVARSSAQLFQRRSAGHCDEPTQPSTTETTQHAFPRPQP